MKNRDAEQLDFLKLILDSTSEGFYSVDTQGNTTLCNAAFLSMLGYGLAEEVIGLNMLRKIHPFHIDGSPCTLNSCPIYLAASTGEARRVAHAFFFRKNGSCFPVEYTVRPVVRDGKREGAICIFSDISQRLAAEAPMREAQALANSVVESSPDCVKVLDLDARMLSMNEEGCRQMEVDDFALCVNQPWLDFWKGEDKCNAQRSFDEAKKGNISGFEGFCATMKGAPRWWEVIVTPIRAADGKVERVLSVSRDITQRHEAQEKLRAANEHLSLMLESAKDYAIISLDDNGNIIIWNAGAQRVFGYHPDEVIHKHISVIFTPEDCSYDAPEQELATAAQKGRASDERWHMRKNGERFYASGTMVSMRDEGGNVTGFLKIARDMTEQQRAQESILEARNAAEAANIAKTEFLANMSHEIRTPMNAIIGLSNILAISQPLTPKQKEFVRTLQTSADSLLSLINDLLDIAKIEARTVELEHIPLSITRLMQEIVSMMSVQVKNKGLRFTGDGECVETRMYMGDPTRLRQIILNLCSNAIKFTDTGGVHVAITCDPTNSQGIEQIRIAVKDSGIGIAPDKLDSIFHKFVQADTSINRKFGGTGLGLTITKTLVEIMGGTISVTSEPGVGSVFEVSIPLMVATHAEVANTDYSLTAIVESTIDNKVKAKVLLVEDYEPNVMVATVFLEEFGYSVDVAHNGIEAFEKFKSNRYVVALMDVQMHGMNGFEATKIIREHERKNNLPRLPIIGMTAHALAGDRERCIASGMDEYISKPFKPDNLQEKIKAAFKVEAV